MTAKNVDSDFEFKCTSVEDKTYEAKGKMAAHLPYCIKYTKISSHEVDIPKEKRAASHSPPKSSNMLPTPKRSYSTGLHFFEKALIKRICCDQLKSLELHKERGVGNKERKHMVVRKLYKLGGWIREGRNKDRFYVPPNTQLPAFLMPQKSVAKADQGHFELGFM